MPLQKDNLWDKNFFESFLFCSCLQTRSERISDFGTFFRKDSQNCFLRVRKKIRATMVFREKNRILSKNNSTFYWKVSQIFLKTTFYVLSGQIGGKTFFIRKTNISFFVKLARVFGNLAKIAKQSCQNCFSRVHNNFSKKVFRKKLALSSFQYMRPVEPWGKVKNFCKVNTLFVVFGHWFIEWKFVFELWLEKSGKMSKLHSIRPEKGLEERIFFYKKLQFFIIWNFRQKISVCWRLIVGRIKKMHFCPDKHSEGKEIFVI